MSSTAEMSPTQGLLTQASQAIRQLLWSGFLHFTGIANKLAGTQMMLKKDSYWTEYYLTQATNSYSEWGAVAKLDQMKKAYRGVNFVREDLQREQSGLLHCHEKYDANVDSVEKQ